MQSSKIASILAFTAMVLIATESRAQTIATKNISLEAAKKVVTEAVKYAKENNAPGGAIAVVDNGGNLVYLERLDGTFPASAEVSIKKGKYCSVVQSCFSETGKFDQWRTPGAYYSRSYFFTRRHSYHIRRTNNWSYRCERRIKCTTG